MCSAGSADANGEQRPNISLNFKTANTGRNVSRHKLPLSKRQGADMGRGTETTAWAILARKLIALEAKHHAPKPAWGRR